MSWNLRLLLLCSVVLNVVAAVPSCGWSISGLCEDFEFGDRYTVAGLGVKSCPAGSKVITGWATCKAAAEASGAGFALDTPDNIEEGLGQCIWCGGCTPQMFRLQTVHGGLAKYVCLKDSIKPEEASEPEHKKADVVIKQDTRKKGAAWPDCQDRDTVIRNAGQALFSNLQAYGAFIGCYLDDCHATDKFIAAEIESCTAVCHTIPECNFWVYGTEDGETKCWFRTGDTGREVSQGWISGSKACAPPDTKVMAMGNEECWAPGFGYDDCCGPQYEPTGNIQCWDGVYNYDRCCFPIDEL